jgi:hypothetical protein
MLNAQSRKFWAERAAADAAYWSTAPRPRQQSRASEWPAKRPVTNAELNAASRAFWDR